MSRRWWTLRPESFDPDPGPIGIDKRDPYAVEEVLASTAEQAATAWADRAMVEKLIDATTSAIVVVHADREGERDSTLDAVEPVRLRVSPEIVWRAKPV